MTVRIVLTPSIEATVENEELKIYRDFSDVIMKAKLGDTIRVQIKNDVKALADIENLFASNTRFKELLEETNCNWNVYKAIGRLSNKLWK